MWLARLNCTDAPFLSSLPQSLPRPHRTLRRAVFAPPRASSRSRRLWSPVLPRLHPCLLSLLPSLWSIFSSPSLFNFLLCAARRGGQGDGGALSWKWRSHLRVVLLDV
ncbi:hypothetical protein EJB05_08858 [Eragrostis curvula]|uniref:Uncharacterized protein n=1 Tax=Eragrostis curvula TaxID=38414 RepID=A0A5J9W3F6_9POAL|nr:hypothetical protein EJB05_08858 [Eragrostis curvula]